jgi:mono/diheme cytochrome c family protein
MPEEINTNDINSNEINEQILLNQDEKITETNQLLGATMQQNEERKQLSEAGLMAQEAIKEKMNGKPSIYVSTIIDAFLESLGEKLKGKDGQKGEKGDMPKKGVDYFTPEDINDIQEYVQSQIKDGEDGYTPIKGTDYFTPDEISSIVSQVKNLISTPKDGRDGRDVAIVKRVLKEVKIPEIKNITASDILKKIKGKIDYNDIKNTPTVFKQGGFKGGMAGQGYFKDLADVNFSDAVNDQSYALKRVNNTWTVTKITKTGAETSWGGITGTLADQVDLKNELDGKEPTVTKGKLTEATSSVLTISGGTGSVIGSGTSIQVKKASSSQDGYLSSTDWGTFNAKQDVLGYTAEDSANKKTDLTDNSDTYYPTQKAVKTYVDGSVAGLLDYRGGYDASGNTYPVAGGSGAVGAVLKGDMWIISVAGTLAGEAVQVGDSIIANIDTPAQVASNWNHLNANISYVPEDVANKVTSFQTTPTDAAYASEKLVKNSLDAKLAITNKATSSDINGGTDNDKYITPDALAGSNFGTKPVQQYCVEWETSLTVKDGVGYIEILPECNGMNLISARARVGTAGVTGNTTFDIYNVTDSTSMLSSAISIASGAKSGTGTVDTAHDDVATGDLIRIDIDSIASGTAPKGLIISLSFRLP